MTDGMTQYAKFTPEMKKTHTILLPNMCPIHFRMLRDAIEDEGYKAVLLTNCDSAVVQKGLKYVHNDTCYPALLVIGQFIDALESGQYDPDTTALLITQTGGGCRASNYIYLLRKALVKAGYPQVPVASLNFSGLEKDSGFVMTPALILKMLSAVFYGDELMLLANQIRPYETHPGDADEHVEKWLGKIAERFDKNKGVDLGDMKRMFNMIADDFATIPFTRVPKVKVGIVGEIYVKFSPLGNNELEKFLASEDCEVDVPGLMGFVQYCVANGSETIRLYGGNNIKKNLSEIGMQFLTVREKAMINAIKRYPQFRAPNLFVDTMKLGDGIIGQGAKMGEGWLLTSEMVELTENGFENIICAQPFGCLPNHIVGKGMINKIRELYPQSNITPIDYDPSATKVNQENRIKLMLSVARENLTK